MTEQEYDRKTTRRQSELKYDIDDTALGGVGRNYVDRRHGVRSDENTMFEDGTASETTRGTTWRPSEENDENVGRHGDRRSEGIRAEGRALALLTAEGGSASSLPLPV